MEGLDVMYFSLDEVYSRSRLLGKVRYLGVMGQEKKEKWGREKETPQNSLQKP